MKKILFLLGFCLFVFAGCVQGNEVKEEIEPDASIKDNSIYVDATLNSSNNRIKLSLDDGSLEKKHSGRHCTVYYSNKLNSAEAKSMGLDTKLTNDYFRELGEKFDSIYELETSILGSNKAPYESSYKRSNNNRSANTEIVYDDNGKKFKDDIYVFKYNKGASDILEENTGRISKINDSSLSSSVKNYDGIIFENEDNSSYLSIDHETVNTYQTNQMKLLESISDTSNGYARSASESLFPATNSKVILVVMDINQDASANQSSGTVGYFSPVDMISESYLSTIYGSDIKGNERQILYLDSNYLLRSPGLVHSTIVHEFNHLLNFIQKNVKVNSYNGLPTWYTEMLAMVSEDMFSSYLNLKISQTPIARFVEFKDGYSLGFTNWRNNNNLVYNSYANAFAYGAYLVRNYGGIDLLNLIATNDTLSEVSINDALAELGYKDKFEDTFYNFYKAVINTSSTGNTLNKSSKYYDKLGFSAISLKDIKYNSNGNTENCYPYICEPDENYDIGAKGCIIYKIIKESVGEDFNFTFEIPSNSNAKENIVIKVCKEGEL